MHDTKDRLVSATAELFKQRGYNATAVKQIVEMAGAPFASLYHFFPGGKEELGAETIRHSGALYAQLVDLFFMGGDVAAETGSFFAAAADTVRESGFTEACPIATVALEVAGTNEVLRVATADVFEQWLDTLTGRYVAAGIAASDARSLASSVLSLLEGAFILALTLRDETHIVSAGATAAHAVQAALDRRPVAPTRPTRAKANPTASARPKPETNTTKKATRSS